jgi:hypothetical protein
MSVFKFWIKISWLISLLLGFFWVGCGIFAMTTNQDSLAGKSYLMALFWFGLTYVLKRANGQNISYKKISEVCAFIFGKAQDKNQLSSLRLMQLLYLCDWEASKTLKKSLFPQAPWSYETFLTNKIAQFWADKSKMFLNISQKGLDPRLMVPPINCSSEELLLVEKVIKDCENKNAFEMQQLVNETYPMKVKTSGPWDLVALSELEKNGT